MTTPLSVWICDICHEDITEPSKALLAWQKPKDGPAHNFRIVHKGPKCDLDRSDATLELHQTLGPSGEAALLALLSAGKFMGASRSRDRVDLDEWVDVFRRVQVPWYEEARQHFSDPDVQDEFAGANEVLVYEQRSLRRIAEIGASAS